MEKTYTHSNKPVILKCTLTTISEQKILKNALVLTIHSPDAFTYHVMQRPGYMALLAGEVIYIAH